MWTEWDHLGPFNILLDNFYNLRPYENIRDHLESVGTILEHFEERVGNGERVGLRVWKQWGESAEWRVGRKSVGREWEKSGEKVRRELQ